MPGLKFRSPIGPQGIEYSALRCAWDRSGFLTRTEIDLTLEALVLAVFAD